MSTTTAAKKAEPVTATDDDPRIAQAADIISNATRWAAVGGVVPLPYVDLLAVSAVQVQMVRKIADVYDIDADEQTLKTLISSMVGTLLPAAASASLFGSSAKVVPFTGTLVGSAAMSAFAAGATYAIGKVFVLHFGNGGTLLDFSADKVKADLKKEFAAAKGK